MKNNNSYITGIVFLKFLLFLIAGVILGGAFFYSPYVDKESIDFSVINRHFDSVFVDCETVSDKLMTVLILSELEIRYLFLLFVSGFTYFCFIAAGGLMIARGFLLGFSSSSVMFAFSVRREIVIAYLLFSIVSSLILVYLSASAYIFSFDFSEIKRNHTVLRRSPVVYKYFFSLILSMGGLLINNFLYCLLIFLL